LIDREKKKRGEGGANLHVHVVGMLEILLNCFGVMTYSAFAKLLTSYEIPSHDQLVYHVSVLPLRDTISVHCEPDVAVDSPQRSL
jgi:hypothetical protein